MESNQIIYILFAIIFFGAWFLLLLVLSKVSGWQKLAINYAAPEKFLGEKLRMQSIKMGRAHYQSSATLGTNSEVLYLSVLLPFHIGHPNLTIPYSDISGVEHKSLFLGHVEIRVAQASSVKIKLRKTQADWLEANSNNIWKYDRA